MCSYLQILDVRVSTAVHSKKKCCKYFYEVTFKYLSYIDIFFFIASHVELQYSYLKNNVKCLYI